MDKAFVAQGVANKLYSTENAVDQAMTEASQLLIKLLEARQELKVAATAGSESFSQVTAAITALSQAREALVAAHEDMAELKLRVGIRTKLSGAWDKPPPPPPSGQLDTDYRDFRSVG